MCACLADHQVRILDFLIGVQIFIDGGGGGGGAGGGGVVNFT